MERAPGNPPEAWPDLLRASPATAEPWQALAQRGGYLVPAHDLSAAEQRQAWFAGYAATYLERDLRTMAAAENSADTRRLMTALCLRSGRLLNQAEVARDLGSPPSTVQRSVHLLEVSYQVVRVPAYAVNRTRRLVKRPRSPGPIQGWRSTWPARPRRAAPRSTSSSSCPSGCCRSR